MRNPVLNFAYLTGHDIGPTNTSTKTSGLVGYSDLSLSSLILEKQVWGINCFTLPVHFFFPSAKSLGVIVVHCPLSFQMQLCE